MTDLHNRIAAGECDNQKYGEIADGQAGKQT